MTNPDAPALKPCPFCGYAPHIEEHDPYEGMSAFVTIECRCKGCFAGSCAGTKDIAIANWNHRAGDEK